MTVAVFLFYIYLFLLKLNTIKQRNKNSK